MIFIRAYVCHEFYNFSKHLFLDCICLCVDSHKESQPKEYVFGEYATHASSSTTLHIPLQTLTPKLFSRRLSYIFKIADDADICIYSAL
jgi:hypothetical protein